VGFQVHVAADQNSVTGLSEDQHNHIKPQAPRANIQLDAENILSCNKPRAHVSI
jgi:hypothetical protein